MESLLLGIIGGIIGGAIGGRIAMIYTSKVVTGALVALGDENRGPQSPEEKP